MVEREGVIQYRLDFQVVALEGKLQSVVDELNHLRQPLFEASLIGQDSSRYGGLGFGNLSIKVADEFLVSGTQTGHLPVLGMSDVALVRTCQPSRNHIDAYGLCEPSSEAMTHGVLYSIDASVNVVVHVHSPHIWRHRQVLGLSATAAHIPYGTPEMAKAVVELWPTIDKVNGVGVFAMAGHEDGIVAAGTDGKSVVCRLLELASPVE